MVKKTFYFLSLLIIFLGCEDTPKHKKVRLKPSNLTQESAKSYHDNAIKLAITPVISPKASLILYADLVEYLRAKSAMNIQIVQGRTYGEVNELLRNAECDMALLCIGPYLRATKDFPIDMLVTPVVNGSTNYHAYIIVNKESKINHFAQLKNKTIACSDPLSLTGYLYIKHRMLKLGETMDAFFSKSIFTGSHDNSVELVAEGIMDAASVDGIVYNTLMKQKNFYALKTKIIEESPPFGIAPIVIRKGISNETKKKLQDIFLNMSNDKEGKRVLEKINIDRFILSDSKIYDSAKLVLKELEMIH